ncbi:SLATT domain-containing protein [Streptomyces hesseae]|uniref:SLATT domain-containing protein n=1 Tax=Streptomyces hesseae TaxID=3075519 RepID=A0ABU2SLR1_9ACTN|nr:SLATT domain-containing protein [Streptomyces sp. DSM 40473]MDT0449927.1 SLATT domain-containing protein [Streptomyces sp. DSM 40473]
MERCRASSRETRIATYKANRLTEQVDWYSRMAHARDKQSRVWRRAALAGELIGVTTGVLKAYSALPLEISGVVSAAVAGITAWFQAHRLDTEAAAYSLTAREIRHILSLLDESASETQWAKFVDQAEAAISREHTMWASGRTGRVGLAD